MKHFTGIFCAALAVWIAAPLDAQGGGRREDKAPKLGDEAPDFEIYRLDDTKKETPVKLSEFEGKKPVVLVFGSYT